MIRGAWFLRWLLAAAFAASLMGSGSVAATSPDAFKHIAIGKSVVSLPTHWTTLGTELPVWIHLHGARDVVESNFAAVGAPGVLVTLTLPGLSKVYADHFAEPAAFETLLSDIERALRRESTAHPWRIGPLTVSSFSAGFGGVRQLLRQPEAFRRIHTLVMADSLYCGYAGDASERRIDPELMSGFLAFARLAAEGQKRMVVSHSRQMPRGYASTTETAEYLIQQLGGARTIESQDFAGGFRLLSQFNRGQFDILGFDGETADDHMRHLRSISVLFERAMSPTSPQRATSLTELRARLEAHVTAPRFKAAAWGVKVISLDTGRLIYAHGAERLLSPASNSKLYAGALALDRLGGDYRIVTPLLATRAPDASGTIIGDVIIAGRGDPSWKQRSGGDFWQVFEPFVAVLARAGVKRIAGDIVADATYFRGPPNGAGWTADDLNDYYGAEISAVTLEDNYAQLRLSPGSAAGQPAVLSFLQPHTGLVLDNRVATIAAGSTRQFEIRRLFGESVVHVFGQLPLGSAPVTEDVTVPRPANWFAASLKDALLRRGIAVEGISRGVRWPDAPAAPSDAIRLGEITSPPLRELLSGLMKPSQNLETDLIFAHVGETLRASDTPEWRTSEQLAVGALREFLRENGLSPDEVRFDEGSGLSRNNLTTANATVALLEFMATHRAGNDFIASLPVAGVDGTLRRRMRGTPAEGNVRAKTGTLRWAIALSGYVNSAVGERLAFSVMLNRAVPASGRNARDDVDAVALMLASFPVIPMRMWRRRSRPLVEIDASLF